jgi:aminoglycoside phosphotransferase (APT) family kinase protein
MSIPRDHLAAAVAEHVASAPDQIVFKPISTGKFNDSYFVLAGNDQLVLRVAPSDDEVFLFYERRMMHQEPELHALLRERTNVPVAAVIAFDASRQVIDRDFILMERLPGRPLTEMGGVDHNFVLHQIGDFLAQTHQIQAEAYGYLGAHRPMQAASSWPLAFHHMWNRLVDDIVGVGLYSQDESDFVRRLLDVKMAVFEREVESSLLHMDVWHQNILVDGRGVVTGLVDWDRALWGDTEIEFAVLDYCGVSEPAFWEGYGRPRDTSPEAEIRRAFYLLYELQKYIVIREGRNRDSAGARRYKNQTFDFIRRHLQVHI